MSEFYIPEIVAWVKCVVCTLQVRPEEATKEGWVQRVDNACVCGECIDLLAYKRQAIVCGVLCDSLRWLHATRWDDWGIEEQSVTTISIPD